MNKERKKLSLALGLVAGLGVLSIAYAALSSTLYIKGNGKVETGQVMFTDCKAASIGTNDVTVNSGAGAYLEGDSSAYSGGYSAGYTTYAPTDAGALAFGKATNADGTISRSNYQSNHDGDTLEIKGTELYDYGSYVVYDVTLKNTAKNPMYLSKVPKISATFGDEKSGENAAESVAVTVHTSKTEAEQYNGSGDMLTAYKFTGANQEIANNYLEPQGETHWFIKIRRLSQAESGAEALKSGNFSFTVHMTDDSENSGGGQDDANAAVWEATAK